MMKNLILLMSLISLPALAVEVVTFDDQKNTSDIQLSFTDESLIGAMDKYFMSQNCKIRNIANANSPFTRDYFITRTCKAEMIKFILNNGYKPLERDIFQK